MDINISSQIVVQTAAQWAADNTVYSNKRILVTSDEYYGSTDQRKFKIADGTQTWSNLDYVPISETIQQVVNNGSYLQGTIYSNNAESYLTLDSTQGLSLWSANGDVGVSLQNPSKQLYLYALSGLSLDGTINLPQGTASKLLKTDANKNITYVDEGLSLSGNNANQDIDVGNYSINAKSFHAKGTGGAGHVGLKHQSSNITASASESSIGANSSGDPVWKNDGNALQEFLLKDSVNTATNYTTPLDADKISIWDTANSLLKAVTWSNIKTTLKTYFDTIYQAAGTYLTSANITQVITNGVTDKAPSEDAVYDALALKLASNDTSVTNARDLKYAAYSNTDSSHTGNTSETYLKGLLVPTLTTNSTLDIFGLLNKTGTAGNITWNLYYNTTNDLTGSPVKISTHTQTSTQLYGGKFIRTIINKNSLTDNYIFRSTVASVNDFTQNANAMTSIGIDLSGKYLIITATLANSGDTAVLSSFQLIHTKP